MLPRRLTLPLLPPAELNPSPSHSCKLFCAPKIVNSCKISNFQTLFAKYPGGLCIRITRHLLLPPSHAPRSASIPSALNQLRILPVATGVHMCEPPPSISHAKTLSVSLRLCGKSHFVCPLFSQRYKSLFSQPLSFHIHPNPWGCGVFRCPVVAPSLSRHPLPRLVSPVRGAVESELRPH